MKPLAVFLSVLLLLASLTVFAEDARTRVGIDNENIVYMGRWGNDGEGHMRGMFECGLLLRFTGTGIWLDGEASGNVLLAIDGGDVKETALSGNMALFTGLEDGEHTLELYAAAQRTFPAISGFAIDAGARTLPFPPGKTVEFIGDSIMEGYVPPEDAVNNVVNSYATSYAFIAGRTLLKEYGTRFNTIAYGGISIVERGKNTYGNDPLGMPERYFLDREYMMRDTPEEERAAAEKWDVSVYSPDIIVINLGTNDTFSGARVLAEAALSYLKALRAAYGKAVILVMTPFNDNVSTALSRAVSAADDEKTVLVNTKGWKIKAGGDLLHPGPQEHVRAAELLLGVLRPYIEAEDGPDDAQTETDTRAISGAPTEAVSEDGGTAQDEKSEGDGKARVLPYIIIGAAVIAAAAAVAIIKIRKKR